MLIVSSPHLQRYQFNVDKNESGSFRITRIASIVRMMPISYGGSQWGRLRVESALDLFIGFMILHKEQRYLYRMKKK